ncbi:MAG TPA: hypothetical protein VHA52_08500, partial [Candidatus Babeliaceae bacterium]|nr:hypothetical protein [Candidatus Babeliaceae bacterium]
MTGKRSIFRNILLAINFVTIALYLITCLYPFVNTSEYWLLAFPGLIFPLLFFALIFFILLWFILKSKWWLLSLIVLLTGFQQVKSSFAFHLPQKFKYAKKGNTLRVLQWNVESWGGYDKDQDSLTFPFMANILSRQNADIMCFEEYFDYIHYYNYEPVTKKLTALGYPYHFFVASEVYENNNESGIAIFSKYPIIDSGRYRFDQSSHGEHLIY